MKTFFTYDKLSFYVPLDTKQVFMETSFQAYLLARTDDTKPTQLWRP